MLEHLTPELLRAIVDAFLIPSDPDDLNAAQPEMIEKVIPFLDDLCRFYYRLEVEGLHKAPPGKALVVINHNAGITFAEILGFGARWYLERGTNDLLHGLGHDGILAVPFLKNFLIKGGGVRASQRHGDLVLQADRKILVAPGGNLEAFRPYRDRHRIDFNGRTGFIRLALRNMAPIVPTVFIGGHETFFVLHDGRQIARRLGLDNLFRLDTFPIFLGLPWGLGIGPLFHFPLPAKCKVRMLDPIPLDGYSPEDEADPAVCREIYDKVTSAMQTALTEMAAERTLPIIG